MLGFPENLNLFLLSTSLQRESSLEWDLLHLLELLVLLVLINNTETGEKEVSAPSYFSETSVFGISL